MSKLGAFGHGLCSRNKATKTGMTGTAQDHAVSWYILEHLTWDYGYLGWGGEVSFKEKEERQPWWGLILKILKSFRG